MTKTIEGVVTKRKVAKGSKSEHVGYFIVTDDGEEKPIRIQGENAFEQPTLRALAGKRCRVEGCTLHGNVWLVKKATRI